MPAFRSPCAARSIEKEFVGSRWLASQSLLTGCPVHEYHVMKTLILVACI